MIFISLEEIDEILTLLEQCDFSFLCESSFEEQFSIMEKYGYKLLNGLTKGVLSKADKNYVIKIPFQYDNEENELCSLISCSSDYCKAEMLVYLAAESYDLQPCFAEIMTIGKVHNVPIYVQQKAVIGVDSWETFAEEYETEELAFQEFDKIDSKYEDVTSDISCGLNPIWISAFLRAYTEERFSQLRTLLLDFGVTDLHDNNIGYIDDYPVLVDYSGFDG